MSQKQLSNQKKKEYAEMLYLNSPMTQKEIAEEVGTSPQTMVKWVADGKWEDLKVSLNATNTKQIAMLQKILNLLNEEAVKYLTDDDPETKPNEDGIIKITKSIAYLRTKTGVGQMYETGTIFLTFLQKENPALAKQVAPLFLAFIKSNL